MRIAMIGQKGMPCTGGGIERNVEDLSANIASLGHEVIAYTRPHYTSPNLRENRGVKLISIPSLHTKHLDAIIHTIICSLHAIYILRADIIHYHGIGPGLCTFIPRILSSKIRVVGTFHSEDWKHQKWSAIAQTSLKLGAYIMGKSAHVTVSISHAIQHQLEKMANKKSIYIPYGVNIRNRKPSKKILKQFSINENTKYILVASRFVKHKGIHEVIKAFKSLKRKSTIPKVKNLKLVLAGGGAFTDNYVKRLHKEAKGCKDIIFTGYQQGQILNALYAHSILFVSPSITEGRSIALLEAIAWGTPVAVADITETREFMFPHPQKPIGTLFQRHNINSIAETIENTLKHPNQAKAKAREGKKLVDRKYNWKKVARLFETVYINLNSHKVTFNEIEFSVEYFRSNKTA